jgi:hypothetical protein
MLENLKGRYHLEDTGIDGRIILKFKEINMVGGCELDLSDSR